jgi:hypothetical protein
MMRRLREEIGSPDSATARAAELIAATRPLDVTVLRQPAFLPAVERHRAAGRVRVAFGLAVTFGSVVAAAATWHGALGWGRHVAGVQASAAALGSQPSVAERDAERPVVNASNAAAAVADLAAESALAATAPNRRAPSAPRRAGSKGPSHDSTASPRETESTLMVEAVRALRRDGDAARAGQLAEEALRRYPRGMQVEEAMALAMEAASALGDGPGARRAAQRYAETFRVGRFADRAQRILAAPPR